MNTFIHKLYLAAHSFIDRDNGQGLTEYALAFTVIALGTVAGEQAVAQQVNHAFFSVASTITTNIMQ
jgi:Flp pilus assembly pilin Flp